MRSLGLITISAAILSFGLTLGAAPQSAEAGVCKKLGFSKKCVVRGDIKKDAINSSRVQNESLTGADIKDGSIGAADLVPGLIGAGLPFVLQDNLSNPIGAVISVFRDGGVLQVSTLVEFSTIGGMKRVVLHAQNAFLTASQTTTVASFRLTTIQFSDPNCTGTPYVFADQGFPPAVWSAGITRATDGSGANELYIATSQITETPTIQSINLRGNCATKTPGDILVPAALVEPDLDTIIPPPFTLQFQP